MGFDFYETLNYQFWGNTVLRYLIVSGIFLATVFLLRVFKKVVIQKIKKLANRTRTDFDDLLIRVIDSVGWGFYVFLSLYIALQFLLLPQILEKIVSYFLLIAIIYYVLRGAQSLIDYGAQKFIAKKEREERRSDSSAIKLLARIAKGILWAVAVLILLQNLGLNISTLIASLGVGGIAIAFALQNVLGDIFASFAIYFDKPFQIDDFIIIGNEMGVVKNVGIKSTRIQTLQGEELVISNKELSEAKVHNYKKMEKRRIVFTFGVVYETPTEKLKKILEIVKKIIDDIEVTETDRVHFKEFGGSSLNFEAVYRIKSNDYSVYMDTQQDINLRIKEIFEKEDIEMAYPTQTIFVKK